MKRVNYMYNHNENGHIPILHKVEIDNCPPPGVDKWCYCWRYSRKDSISNVAIASTLTTVQIKSDCKNSSWT